MKDIAQNLSEKHVGDEERAGVREISQRRESSREEEEINFVKGDTESGLKSFLWIQEIENCFDYSRLFASNTKDPRKERKEGEFEDSEKK